MNPRLTEVAMAGLRWVTGLVLFLKSAHLAFSPAGVHQFSETRLPEWMPSALGGTEAVAALLFLVPATRLVGGFALLFTFATAVAINLLHRQFDVGALLIYSTVVLACMAYRSNEPLRCRMPDDQRRP